MRNGPHRAAPAARYVDPITAGPVRSFSQNAEDVRLLRIFDSIDRGFWVDVGAGGPEVDSMTALFSERGWTGLNLEPGVDFDELLAKRPDDINLRVAVAEEPGTMTLFVSYERTGWSTTVPAAHEHLGAVELTPIEVEALPLDAILETHLPAGTDIDLLKIDVEGAEASVLRSIDLARWLPTVVVVEAVKTHSRLASHHEWEPGILASGYQFAVFDGINRFYVPNGRSDLAEALAYPISALDNHHLASAERERARLLDVAEVAYRELETRVMAAEATARAETERADVAEAALVDYARELFSELQAAEREAAEMLAHEAERRYVDWARVQSELDAVLASRSYRLGSIIGRSPDRAVRLSRRAVGKLQRHRAAIQPVYDGFMQSSERFGFVPGQGVDRPAGTGAIEQVVRLLPEPGRLLDDGQRLALAKRLDSFGLRQEPALHPLDPGLVERRALVELLAALELPAEGPRRPATEAETRTVVVDGRCLQDPNFATRGIGKLASGVLNALAADATVGEVILLVDPLLPAVSAHTSSLVGRVEANPARVDGPVDLYLDPAPMTSPIRFGRSLFGRAAVSVGIVHDFIPATHPATYLADPIARVEYAARLLQLARFDRLWANSAATAEECIGHLEIGADAVDVIGVSDPLHGITPGPLPAAWPRAGSSSHPSEPIPGEPPGGRAHDGRTGPEASPPRPGDPLAPSPRASPRVGPAGPLGRLASTAHRRRQRSGRRRTRRALPRCGAHPDALLRRGLLDPRHRVGRTGDRRRRFRASRPRRTGRRGLVARPTRRRSGPGRCGATGTRRVRRAPRAPTSRHR